MDSLGRNSSTSLEANKNDSGSGQKSFSDYDDVDDGNRISFTSRVSTPGRSGAIQRSSYDDDDDEQRLSSFSFEKVGRNSSTSLEANKNDSGSGQKSFANHIPFTSHFSTQGRSGAIQRSSYDDDEQRPSSFLFENVGRNSSTSLEANESDIRLVENVTNAFGPRSTQKTMFLNKFNGYRGGTKEEEMSDSETTIKIASELFPCFQWMQEIRQRNYEAQCKCIYFLYRDNEEFQGAIWISQINKFEYFAEPESQLQYKRWETLIKNFATSSLKMKRIEDLFANITEVFPSEAELRSFEN